MIPTRCLTLRYPQCILCTMGSNAPLSGMMAQYLPKLRIGIKRTCMVKVNLHAEEDFLQKIKSLHLDPPLKKLLLTS